jgi:hypothetical protein
VLWCYLQPEKAQIGTQLAPNCAHLLLRQKRSDKFLRLIGSVLLHIGKRVRIPLKRKGDGGMTGALGDDLGMDASTEFTCGSGGPNRRRRLPETSAPVHLPQFCLIPTCAYTAEAVARAEDLKAMRSAMRAGQNNTLVLSVRFRA